MNANSDGKKPSPIKKKPDFPRKLKEDVDFAYVNDLSEQEQRGAAYYEYARHSDPIKELVLALRKTGAFDGCPPSAELQELIVLMNRKDKILRMDQLLPLYRCKDFPDEPYKHSLTNLGNDAFIGPFSYPPSYGIDAPGWLPWDLLLERHDQWNTNKSRQLKMLEKLRIYAVHIPWKFRDEEIAKLLVPVLKRMRPKDCPEPSKAGRRGRFENLGIGDMLHQLAAYRLKEAGYGSEASKDLHVYTSDRGWKNANREAEARISSMMDRPFFG